VVEYNRGRGLLSPGDPRRRIAIVLDRKEQVIDMGSVWTFRFRYLGDDVGQVSVPRSDLEAQKWRFVIPEEMGRRLQEQGVPPSYL
jgi:hypothetical protein